MELNLPALGDDVNTWGAPILNNNQTTIDQVLGTSSPNISLGSGGTTTITNVNAAFQIIVLTGTLTSNATLQFPSTMGGRRYIDSSAVVLNGFTITVQNGASDPGIIVAGAQGFGATRVPIVLNQSNAAYDQAGQAVAAALSNQANGANGLVQLNASGFAPALSKMGITSGAAQAAGNIGQIISADVPIGSAITLFGATPANICSVPSRLGSGLSWEISNSPYRRQPTSTRYMRGFPRSARPFRGRKRPPGCSMWLWDRIIPGGLSDQSWRIYQPQRPTICQRSLILLM